MISKEEVRSLFNHLANGESQLFFDRVSDQVDWTVMGTHPLAGRYLSKESFFSATFARLNRILNEGVLLVVQDIHVDGDTAIVEMESISTQKNGKPFDNKYCWVVDFDANKTIVLVRAYLDSALVAQAIYDNEKK